jgi:hypothetical protein
MTGILTMNISEEATSITKQVLDMAQNTWNKKIND